MATDSPTGTAPGSSRFAIPSPRSLMLYGGIPALLLAAYLIWGNVPWLSGSTEADTAFVTEVARRAPLRVTVSERGRLDSLSNVALTSSVEGTTTIISIVPEGIQAATPIRSGVTGTVVSVHDPVERDEDGKPIRDPDDEGNETSDSLVGEVVVKTADGETLAHSVLMGPYTRFRVSEKDEVAEGDILAGDLLCELDSSSIGEQHKEMVIKFKQAEADLVKARANVSIQGKQNESDEAAARLAKLLAELDLEKFEKGESKQQQNEIRGEMTLAEEELARAREVFDFTKRLARKGYKSLNDLEADRLAVTKAEIGLSVARDKLGVLEEFTYARTMAELRETEAEAGRALERQIVAGKASLEGYQAELEARELAHEVEQTKLKRLERQLDACRLFAPQGGVVVYAAADGSRRSEPVVIEEGANVRERQTIINLPDLARMKVKSNVHESRISLVNEKARLAAFAQLDADDSGDLVESEVASWMWTPLQHVDADRNGRIGLDEFRFPVQLKIDAYPGEAFTGVVQSIADVSSDADWMRPNLQQYETEITVVDFRGRELKPGMNAVVEIVTKQRENVLQIPVQSVVSVGAKRYGWVIGRNGPERRTIEIGDASGTSVEVKSGIEEGEQIVLNPRTHFTQAIEDLRADGKKGEPGDKKKGKGKK